MTSYDYQEALKNAAKTMVRVKNPRRLLKMIVRFIVKEVGLTHASILMYDQLKSRYIFVDSKGNHRIPISLVKLDNDNPLIHWFSNNESGVKLSKDFLTTEQLNSWIQDGKLVGKKPALKERLTELQNALETLKVTF